MSSAAEAVPIVIFRSPHSENRRGSFPASNRVITVFREIWRSFQGKFSICTERFRLISSGSFVYTLNSPLNPKLCAGSPTSRAEVVVFRSLRWVWVSKSPLQRTRHLGFSKILQTLNLDKKILSAKYWIIFAKPFVYIHNSTLNRSGQTPRHSRPSWRPSQPRTSHNPSRNPYGC